MALKTKRKALRDHKTAVLQFGCHPTNRAMGILVIFQLFACRSRRSGIITNRSDRSISSTSTNLRTGYLLLHINHRRPEYNHFTLTRPQVVIERYSPRWSRKGRFRAQLERPGADRGGSASESCQLHEQEGSITKLLHLRPLPLLPLERWLLGAATAAAAAAPPVAAAQPPFSCSSPLLLLRLLFFPLLLFWLGIFGGASDIFDLTQRPLSPPTGIICGIRLCIVLSWRRCYCCGRRPRGQRARSNATLIAQIINNNQL